MADITTLQRAEASGLVGPPLRGNYVLISGRIVPGLTCVEVNDESIELVVDERFASIFPRKYAEKAAFLIANALAVAAGYSHFEAETKDERFAAQFVQLSPENVSDILGPGKK